jgi:hypothetical protein
MKEYEKLPGAIEAADGGEKSCVDASLEERAEVGELVAKMLMLVGRDWLDWFSLDDCFSEPRYLLGFAR